MDELGKSIEEYESTLDEIKRTVLNIEIARLLEDTEGQAKEFHATPWHDKMKAMYEACK